MDQRVDEAYTTAQLGDWTGVLALWREDERLALLCAHYVEPASGWTFLHQAAFFGAAPVCRELIRLGANVDALARDGQTPETVATCRGHDQVASLLAEATLPGQLWRPPADANFWPSSCRWEEATECRAGEDMVVSYGGGKVPIPAGERYFVDSFGRVLVGWHGTFDPPRGMDGCSMLDDEDS